MEKTKITIAPQAAMISSMVEKTDNENIFLPHCADTAPHIKSVKKGNIKA
jgi:hypothetical protein